MEGLERRALGLLCRRLFFQAEYIIVIWRQQSQSEWHIPIIWRQRINRLRRPWFCHRKDLNQGYHITNLATIMYRWYPQTYPNLCPWPLKFPVSRPNTPLALRLVPCPCPCSGDARGGITVPYGLCIPAPTPPPLPCLPNKFLNHTGVSNLLPPCRGHSSVKKRCKCAPSMPVNPTAACTGPEIIKSRARKAQGYHGAGTLTT